MKSFFVRIWMLWLALIFFIVFSLLFVPLCLSLLAFKNFKIALALQRFWASCIIFLGGLRYTVDWQFTPQPNTAYVICCNHTSYLDIVLPFCFWPQFFLFVGKNEHAEAPFFGLLFKNMHIPLHRQKPVLAKKALDRCVATLKNGTSLLLFPEGTIAPTAPQMLPFKDGAFKLAADAGVEIIPVTFVNCWRVLPDHRKHQHRLGYPGRVNIIVGKPISVANVAQAKADVFEIIRNSIDYADR